MWAAVNPKQDEQICLYVYFCVRWSYASFIYVRFFDPPKEETEICDMYQQ